LTENDNNDSDFYHSYINDKSSSSNLFNRENNLKSEKAEGPYLIPKNNILTSDSLNGLGIINKTYTFKESMIIKGIAEVDFIEVKEKSNDEEKSAKSSIFAKIHNNKALDLEAKDEVKIIDRSNDNNDEEEESSEEHQNQKDDDELSLNSNKENQNA